MDRHADDLHRAEYRTTTSAGKILSVVWAGRELPLPVSTIIPGVHSAANSPCSRSYLILLLILLPSRAELIMSRIRSEQELSRNISW